MNCNFITLATKAMLGLHPKPYNISLDLDYVAVKVSGCGAHDVVLDIGASSSPNLLHLLSSPFSDVVVSMFS